MLFGNTKKQRLIVSIVTVIFVANLIVMPIHQAQAQLVVTDPITGQATTIKNIKDFIIKLLVGVAGVALINATNYFAQKLAYDAAVALATGGKGEMPLFSSKGWGDYFRDVSLNAVGEFVGSLSEGFPQLNLCDPGPAGLRARIQTGMVNAYLPVGQGPEPKCEWNDIQENWDEFTEEFTTGEVLERTGVMFETGQSPLSITLEAGRQLSYTVYEMERAKELERVEGEGFMAKTGIISGEIQTPAQVIAQKGKELSSKGEESQMSQTQMMGQALSSGATQILATVLGTFVNTLAGTLLDRIFNEGLFSLADLRKKGGRGALINPEFSLVGTRQVAQEIYSDFITPPIKQAEVYDLVTDFSICPSQFSSPNNCVIDNSFAEAIRREATGSPLSVKEAVDQGLLHGDWPLVSSYDRARNTDPYCHTYGYCYSNLVKLRKARIIPIGWEIAAQKSGNVTAQATLREIMESFYECGIDDAGNAVADDAHPWCHLIDPNWIIKFPLTQCRASVYGPTLVTAENSLRTEICVDAPSCVAVDDENNCVGGWGYCTREKNTWHFDGNACPAIYESCLSLNDRDGNEANYLLNTVNYSVCNAENVGCRWYATEQSGGDWSAATSYDADNYSLFATDGAVYFDKDANECSTGEAGCTEFYRASEAAVTLNLLNNPGFENTSTTNPGFPDAWFPANPTLSAVTYDQTGDRAYEGVSSVDPSLMGVAQDVRLNPSRFYTLSFYAKNTASSQMSVQLRLLQSDGITEADLTDYYINGLNCEKSNFYTGPGNETIEITVTPPEVYARYNCTFTTPGREISPYYLGRIYAVANPGGAWIDAIQLEESEIATSFHQGISAGAESVYLKKPPAYLGCTGGEGDPDECGNYLRPCNPLDVGCKMYYPASNDPALAAIATSEDICPAECVGYSTFREEPTQWSSTAQFPIFFIPDTAEECSASDVGCDEFTNLDAPEVGGETLNYFTSIRTCQKPADDTGTYYTWEGSDTTGYQLKTWFLKDSNQDAGPCTALAPDGTCDDPAIGTPEYADVSCEDVFGVDADCRQFYNTEGDIFYRYYSRTILSTDECYRYRKTENTGQEDCEATNGRWTEGGECIYLGYPGESQICAAEVAGCRAYTGPTSRNIEDEFTDSFEDGTDEDWVGGTNSNESVILGGHSLKIVSGGDVAKEWTIESEETYILSFWAKGQGEIAIMAAGTTIGRENITGEWNNYEVGPVRIAGEVSGTPQITFEGFTRDSYLDNISLKRVSDHIYLLRNSWYTPLSCDQNNQGVYLPQAQLGCREYSDDEGDAHYFKSFDRLCSDEAVGCEAMIDTYNSDSVYQQVFNEGLDGAEVVVPADTVSYYVYDDNFSCTEDAKGCELLGKPILSQDQQSVIGWEDAYLINDPELYDQTLCLTEEAYCEEYTGETGTYYFKYPEDKTCEFREQVTIGGIEFNGWFKTGTDEPCYSDFLSGGNNYGIWKNGDASYDAWYGTCPREYSLCTKFIDPSDKSDEYPEGEEYYYLYDESLDQSCTTVSKGEGCALFDNTMSSTKTYNSWATYLESADNNFAGVSPVDCRSSDSKYCTNVCRYDFGTFVGGMFTDIDVIYGHSCRDSLDCNEYSGYLTKTCEDISEAGFRCRKYNEGLNNWEWGDTDCSISGCPSGWECVNASEELRQNDSNEIFKVRRDRECAEWLGCRSSVSVWDNETQDYKNICTNLGLCNEYATAGELGECTNFIESVHPGDVLTESIYTGRDVSWEGLEYSGYAIPNYYSIDEMRPIDLSPLTGSTIPDLRLAYISGDVCSPNGSVCGDANALGNTGVCVDGECIYAIDGSALPENTDSELAFYNALNNIDNKYRIIGPSCRAYPEETSPFPSSVASWEDGKMTTINQNFKRANICEETVWQDLNGDGLRDENELTYQDCECNYLKATFGNGAVTKYYSQNETNIPLGICLNGPRAGQPCVPDIDFDDNLATDSEHNLKTCGSVKSGGTCQPLERTDTFVGWEGQCLERDLRTTLNGDPEQTACLTWHPSYILSGGQDIYNLYPSAGYNPGMSGNYWCLLGRGLRTPIGPEGAGEDYEVLTRKKWKILKAQGSRDEYAERFHKASDYEENFHYDDIVAIELIVKSANSTKDYPDGRNDYTRDFYKDGGNILSRNNEIDLSYGYKAWEVSWNLPDDFEIPSSAPPVFADSSLPYSSIDSGEDSITADLDNNCSNEFAPNQYFGIRAVFDEKGMFKGWWSSVCDDSRSDGWVKFDIVFHLAENCLVVAQTVDEEGKNKAYTDRLYQASNYILPVGSEYEYTQTFAPFGSAQSAEAPMTPLSYGVEVSPWIVGDNAGDLSRIGVPDLSVMPEEYTLAGSSFGCLGSCAESDFFDLNFRTNIDEPMNNLMGLFAHVYNLYAWFPGRSEKSCVLSGGWPEGLDFYMPCGEDDDCNNAGGTCSGSEICYGGIFNGDRCNDSYLGRSSAYCEGLDGECIDDGEGTFLCENSVRGDELCVEGVGAPDDGSYTSKGGVTVDVPSDTEEIGNDFCQPSGYCIDWDPTTETDWRCYGGINHDDPCTSDAGCNINTPDTDCEDGLCVGGVYELTGNRTSCESRTDCLVGASNCATEIDVTRRCSGGIFDGAPCDVVDICDRRDLVCEETDVSPVATRGYVTYACDGNANDPCLTDDDCPSGVSCEPLDGRYVDYYDFTGDALNQDRADVGWPPTIAAINFKDCDQITGTCRTARTGAFNINNWYYGAITGQDQLKATMRFYAWADHDQMPIVSRTIDWGDESPLDQTTSSKYKNHKPYCGIEVKECTGYQGMTCKTNGDCPGGTGVCQPTDAPHFGNDPAACTQGYFQFEHTYLCNKDIDLPDCGFDDFPSDYGDVDEGGCQTDTACFYRPRIQFLDNWGWCTGSCFDTPGCYDASDAGGTNYCDISGDQPWIYFDGYVKVNK